MSPFSSVGSVGVTCTAFFCASLPPSLILFPFISQSVLSITENDSYFPNTFKSIQEIASAARYPLGVKRCCRPFC
uniref:Uncharacterized protein n=1 Tax=Sparus aurata TaxID=8175 RepID=A0A671WGF6_SPAAU